MHLPEWAFAMRAGINQDYYSSSIRLYASNPVLPEVPMELNLGTGQLQQLETQQQQTMQQGKQQQSCNQPLSYRPAAASAAALAASQQQPLECKRLWATARDGVQVPVTLLHGSGLQYDGQAPLLVEVYGAYGQVLEADFRPHRLALLARGWAVALAHVRGGGECGRRCAAHHTTAVHATWHLSHVLGNTACRRLHCGGRESCQLTPTEACLVTAT